VVQVHLSPPEFRLGQPKTYEKPATSLGYGGFFVGGYFRPCRMMASRECCA
jgi:hypothetical protein